MLRCLLVWILDHVAATRGRVRARARGTAFTIVGAASLVVTVLAVTGSSSASSPTPLSLAGEKPYFSFSSQSLSDRMGLAVNVASGNLIVENDDARIAGTGLDLSVARFYNSQSGQSTDFGGYWTMASGADVRVAYDTPASGDATFYGPSGYVSVLTPNGSGGFNPPDGLDASLTHNSDGTSTLKWDRNGETYNFNSAGQLHTDVDRNNNTVTYNYTSGHLSSIVDTRGRTLTVTTNSAGQITKLQDSSGRSWTYCYNSAGDLTQYTDPNGKSTYYQYTGTHLLSQITDPNGNVTKITYGSGGQVASISRAAATSGGSAETTNFTYSLSPTSPCASGAYGETTVTDPNGHPKIYCYDNSGKTTLTQNADGSKATKSWGADNLPTTETSPDQAAAGTGVNTTLGYNSDHAITGITVATGANSSVNEQINYNPSSSNPERKFFPSSITDTQGNTTTYTYDGSGNLTAVKNALGSQNSLNYNSHGEITSVSDGNGHTHSYTYDSQGQLTTLTPAKPSSLGTTTIGYDGLSRITSVTDGKGQKRTYSYDCLDRITQIVFGDGSKESYTYDGDGNLLTQTDTSTSGSAQTTTFSYDALNRPAHTAYATGKSLSYAWDGANNLTSFTDGGGTVTYSYDPANILKSLVDPAGTTTFGHNSGGKRTSTTFPNGDVESFGYDAADRVTSVSTKDSAGNVLSSDNYSYTKPGGGDTLLLQSFSDNIQNKTVYSYDSANQLTRAQTTNSAGTTTDDYRYSYDPAGNHTSQTTMYNGGASTTQTLTYNAANQLCWSIVGSYTNACSNPPTGATQFSYDANGNELGATNQIKLTWNAKDQMTSEQDNPSASVTQYAYLGSGQGDRVQEGGKSFENSNLGISASTSGSTTTTYTRDPQGLVIDSHQPGGTGQFYIYDGQGDVIGLLDHTGALHRTFKYGPAGGVSKDSGSSIDTAIRYHGAWNGAGNMFHFGARDYDPILREWTQPDPLDQPKDLEQSNWYVYGGNDPINNTDTTGEGFWSDVLKVGSIAEDSLYTVASAGLAVAGTTTCLGATGGNPTCGLIGVTAGTAAAAGAYATYKEIQGFGRGEASPAR